MTGVEPSDEIVDRRSPRLRGGFEPRYVVSVAPLVVAASILVFGVLALSPHAVVPERLTSATLAGHVFRVVGGLNQNLPDRVALDRDGTFRVMDEGGTVDSGMYTVLGDRISFTSVWEEGRGPAHYGILWAEPDCAGCHVLNVPMISDRCEQVVGEYQLVFDETGAVTLTVVWDKCLQRTLVANGLQLEMISLGEA